VPRKDLPQNLRETNPTRLTADGKIIALANNGGTVAAAWGRTESYAQVGKALQQAIGQVTQLNASYVPPEAKVTQHGASA